MISFLPRGRALVTAAGSAIGAIYAHRLAKRGYDLVLAAANINELERFAAWLASCTGCIVETVRFDAACGMQTHRLVDRIRSDDDLTMLVNNAASHEGSGWSGDDLFRSPIAFNFDAPALLAYAAGAAFAKRNRGAIINIATPISSQPAQGESGGRRFLKTLTESLDSELRGRGVRTQAVLPSADSAQFRSLAEEKTEHLSRDAVLAAESMIDQALASFENGDLLSRPTLPATDDPVKSSFWGSGVSILRTDGTPPARP